MNFPTLETCRAIGAEFPDSEFVWVKYGVLSTSVDERVLVDDHIQSNKIFGIEPPEIIANAPTCEELGNWLLNHGKELFALWGSDEDGNNWILADEGYFDDESWKTSSLTETQARAEAVELILERK